MRMISSIQKNREMEQYNAKTQETTSVDYLTARGNEPR